MGSDAEPQPSNQDGGPGKQCQGCRKWHPEAVFHGPSGRITARCPDCLRYARNQNRAVRARLGPSAIRAENLRQKYRITTEQYDGLRSAQEFRCAICGVHENDIAVVAQGRPRLDGTPTAESVRLVVDHCHRSGRIRGLLCAHCNAMIGQARDRPEVLRAAAEYLESDPGIETAPAASCKLRIVDTDPTGRPSRAVRFAGSVTVRIDGYLVRLEQGETKTVVSPTGVFEVVRPSGSDPEAAAG